MKLLFRGAGILAVLLFFTTTASAQATRTWVSGTTGDDINPCSITAPCKTFAGAISKTAAGGEIDVLDDGGFGPVTIGKSLTIDGGGHVASIVASGLAGITVNAAATDVVTLRRLQINGAGATTGTYGVRVLSAKHVNIEDSEIFGFTGTPGVGIYIGTGAATSVQISNTRMENNDIGLQALAFATVTVVSCSIVGNGTGVDASGVGAPPQILISNSNISLNGTGIQTSASALVRLTHNDIVAAAPALTWNIIGGQIQTYRDNRVMGTGTGALTDVP